MGYSSLPLSVCASYGVLAGQRTGVQPGSNPYADNMADFTTRREVSTGGALAAGSALLRSRDATSGELGMGRSGYGERSKYESAHRLFTPGPTPATGSARSPLQDLYGIITSSSLHFERHHSGIPSIDPTQHELLVHGLVERPLELSMDEIGRLPSVSRIHFIECAGNAGREHRGNPG